MGGNYYSWKKHHPLPFRRWEDQHFVINSFSLNEDDINESLEERE
jgi:hypothetical protein